MRDSIQRYYKTRQKTEHLCEPLEPEDFLPQASSFVSPPKWHLAHTSWFFEELILKPFLPEYRVFDERYSFLFNSYYNSLGDRIERANRGLISRPRVDEVFAYRHYIDHHMSIIFEKYYNQEIAELVRLGINHEQQHQELLITDLKYTFSFNPIYPKYSDQHYLPGANKSADWISIEEGVYEIGQKGEGFCYDNEKGRHRVFLENFEISEALVTYGEYIDFIDDGGYSNPRFWLDDGWHWNNQNGMKSPLYWKKIDNDWHHYTLSGLKKIDKNKICAHLSFYEAAAYAFWAECRLPTEFEWEVASPKLNWGEVWEWMNSAYLPYPNFEIAKGAAGEYNGKFMINTMVMRGSSRATAQNHSRNTYRNFFHPSSQWQFSGIRLAK